MQELTNGNARSGVSKQVDGGASVFEDTRAGADLGREEFESGLCYSWMCHLVIFCIFLFV